MITADVLLYRQGETGPSGESGFHLDIIPLAVQFKVNISSGTPIAFHWDFGDGGSSDIREPLHTYNTYGSHRVVLKATDSTGDYFFYFDLVLGKIDFTATPVRGLKPLTVNFVMQSISPTGCHFTGMVWGFGDGSTGMVSDPTHIYPENGKYNVSIDALFTND